MRFALAKPVAKALLSIRAVSIGLAAFRYVLGFGVLCMVTNFFIHPAREGWNGGMYFLELCLAFGAAAHYASLRLFEKAYGRLWERTVSESGDTLP